MRVAALDLGSNTTLLLIAEVMGRRIERVIADESRVTKMGQGVNASRRFHPEAMARLKDCLVDYARLIREHQCDKVVAVATSAARDVTNGDELLSMAGSLGIPVKIISGSREAEITFWGALSDRATTDGCAVVDVGGGSTEIIRGSDGGPRGTSLDVGSVRLTEMFVKSQPVDVAVIREISDYVQRAYKAAGFQAAGIREVIAVAGTPTTLAALDQARDFSDGLVNGYKLSLERMEEWLARLAAMTVEERERLPGMQPKRADVIVTGAAILAAVVRGMGKSEVTVSTRGVRYGAALAWQDF